MKRTKRKRKNEGCNEQQHVRRKTYIEKENRCCNDAGKRCIGILEMFMHILVFYMHFTLHSFFSNKQFIRVFLS